MFRRELGFLMIVMAMFACKTNNLVKNPIPTNTESSVIGLVIQFNQAKDTSEIQHSFSEALHQCGWTPLVDIFKPMVYLSENFELLFKGDSTFIKAQKTLSRLNQILVVKLQYVVKNDSKSGKNSLGMTCNARWISLPATTLNHEFYYAEKIDSPDNTMGLAELQSFLGTQIYLKLCLDIQKYISKKN